MRRNKPAPDERATYAIIAIVGIIPAMSVNLTTNPDMSLGQWLLLTLTASIAARMWLYPSMF